MSSPTPTRLLPVLTFLALQAAFWLVLALAFAALLVLAGSLSWVDAFGISALNWLPWAVLAPGVFWLSLRCPLLPGALWRSIPAHVAASAACIVLTVGVALQFGPVPFGRRPEPGPGGERLEFRGPRPPDAAFRFPGPGPGPGGSAGQDFRRRAATQPDGPGAPGEESMKQRREFPPLPVDGDDPRANQGPRDRTRKSPEDFGRGKRGFGPDGPGRGFGGRGGPGPGGFSLPLGSLLLRVNFDLAVYLIVAAGAHALAFYRRAQERDRQALELAAGLNRAKLDALRLQLQPHFLFNTLNAIATLVHRDAHAADNLIGDLSDLLRLSLLTTDHEVPLARELELLDRYLAIEQTRLGDRLRLTREIEPAVTAALVPTFVLQPLAENAIRHGLEPRSAPGTLTISARRDGDTLHLVVADDGVGLASDQLTSRRGIGLANTEARLQALHGATAKLELHTPPEGGLRVELTLPFKTTPQPAASA